MIRPNKLGLHHHYRLTTNLMLPTLNTCLVAWAHGCFLPKGLGNYVGNKPVDGLAIKARRVYTSSLTQLSFSWINEAKFPNHPKNLSLRVHHRDKQLSMKSRVRNAPSRGTLFLSLSMLECLQSGKFRAGWADWRDKHLSPNCNGHGAFSLLWQALEE